MSVAARDHLVRTARRGQSPWALAGRRFLQKKTAVFSLILILTFYLSGIFAPLIAPYSYTVQNLEATLQSPSLAHPFGTDRLGRDVFSRVIWGARTSVIVSVASVVTGALFLGLGLGALAGLLGRWVDTVIMRIGDIFLAFPGLLLVFLIAATVRPRVVEFVTRIEVATGIKGLVASGAADYLLIFGALSFFSWVGMARLIRGQILSLKETPFVDAARAAGATTWRIILVHLLPNAISPILVSVSAGLGGAIGSELFLSWLGIGVQPPTPSLGVMIWENQSVSQFQIYPHLLLFPVSVVALIFFSFNLLGEGLIDVLNPRAR